MRRAAWLLIGCVLLILILTPDARASTDGAAISADGWAALKSLGWPGAFLGAMFSPVGKAIAGLIQAMTPTRAAASSGAGDQAVTEALKHMAAAVQRQNEINSRTVEALQQIQQGLAILLDRTQRQAMTG